MYINVLNIYNDKTNAVTSLHGSVAAFYYINILRYIFKESI